MSSFFLLFLGGFGLNQPGVLTPADLQTGVSATQYTSATPPSSLLSYITNGTWTTIIATDGWTSTGTINNGSIQVKLYQFNDSSENEFQVDSFFTGGYSPFTWQYGFEHFVWYTNSSKLTRVSMTIESFGVSEEVIWGTMLDYYYGLWHSANFTFYISNSRAYSNVYIAFNNGTYAEPSDAWKDSALLVSFDAGYSEAQSSNNVLVTIVNLLTWNTPGVPGWVFALVDIAVGAPIAYVVGIWILRIMGSVFGGGASG